MIIIKGNKSGTYKSEVMARFVRILQDHAALKIILVLHRWPAKDNGQNMLISIIFISFQMSNELQRTLFNAFDT